MGTPPFTLPAALVDLLANGAWPANNGEAIYQNIRSPIAAHAVGKLADDEDYIHLFAPPFSTIADHLSAGREFWDEFGALEEIDPAKAVIIADFGLGSDSPIVLDYRANPTEPPVLRLKWEPPYPTGNGWKLLAPDFASFADILALRNTLFRRGPSDGHADGACHNS